VPPGGPTPGVFLTRWVTHFCAPAFVFLAGTSAYLAGERLPDRGALSRFLVTRGLWLVLLELTLLRLAWTFNGDYRNFTFAGVIWAIGWCMVLLAALVRLPTPVIAAVGAVIVFGHNALDPVLPALRQAASEQGWGWLLTLLYSSGGVFRLGGEGPQVVVLYSILPWIGVMALGYAFGVVMRAPARTRDRFCLAAGLAAVGLFVILRATGVYGDPRPWNRTAGPARPAAATPAPAPAPARPGAATPAATAPAPPNAAPAASSAPARPPQPRAPAWIAFLNTAKSPASLLFLLMTLGPMLLLIPPRERRPAAGTEWLAVFGRVPFFYYVLHIPLIHLVAVAIALVRTPGDVGWLVANHPMAPPPVPEGYRWSLPLLYVVTAAVVALLYPLCRWYAAFRRRHPDLRFLRYL
ncbi:MAG TPA: heparan-alpha-glucosaminide N-acetyltransferase domain-containing protein, partial [Gemmatimonadales bacterium]|nr:heparan-alpha-glucosaminide N-acetyltransferase domain-containing protein [Gemmatimonadales bacterium]